MQAASGARLLLVISGFFAVTALATTSVMIGADRAATVREVQQRNAGLTQALEEHAHSVFDICKVSLEDLVADALGSSGPLEVTPDSVALMATWLERIPQIASFWLFDAEGRAVYSTQHLDTTGLNFSDREYFIAHRNGEDLHIGRMTRGRLDKAWFFSLSKRLTDGNGRFRGVILASIRTEYFAALYNRLGLGSNDNIAINRTDGSVVVRRLDNWSGETAPSSADHPIFTRLLPNAPSGEFEAVSPIDHTARLGAYRRVAGWPLVVSAAADRDTVLAPWRHRAMRNAVFCMAMLMALGSLSWWGYRRVTSETRLLAALAESQRMYQAIGDSIDYGIWACTADGRNTNASPSFLRLLGITQQQCSDFGWADLLHPDDAATSMAAWQDCVRTGATWDAELRFRGVDGQWHPVLVRGVPVRDDTGNVCCWTGLTLDISRLKQTEDNLKRSQAQLKTFIQRAPIAIAMFDRDMTYLAVSDRWYEDYGRGFADLIGRSHYQVHPDLPAEWKQVHQQGLCGIALSNDEDLWIQADGSKLWTRWAVVPWTDETGAVGGIIISSENITQRKQAEESLKNAKAEAERAVLARSKFLAAASHDLRQPVQSLVLLLGVLKTQEMPAPVTRVVGLMEDALGGLNGLLTSILDVSRLDAGVVMPQVQTVDIGALLERLAQEYELLAAGKGLRLTVMSKMLMTRTDPVLLERILRNLVENAIRYTEAGGILLGMRRRGDRVRIDVVDTGIGIAPQHQSHIFEEFYQVGNPARDRHQGLGLGLAIVGRVTRLLGGQLEVSSREGHGARFSLLLPFDHAPQQAAAVVHAAGETTGRILIIEDDTTLRTGLQLLVESWGCQVVAVASGEEALALGAEPLRQFKAIIADHRLGPGLNGTRSAKEIAGMVGSPIPTLVVTGDTAPERIAEVHASGFDMMHKPVAAEKLRQKLSQMLRGAGS